MQATDADGRQRGRQAVPLPLLQECLRGPNACASSPGAGATEREWLTAALAGIGALGGIGDAITIAASNMAAGAVTAAKVAQQGAVSAEAAAKDLGQMMAGLTVQSVHAPVSMTPQAPPFAGPTPLAP